MLPRPGASSRPGRRSLAGPRRGPPPLTGARPGGAQRARSSAVPLPFPPSAVQPPGTGARDRARAQTCGSPATSPRAARSAALKAAVGAARPSSPRGRRPPAPHVGAASGVGRAAAGARVPRPVWGGRPWVRAGSGPGREGSASRSPQLRHHGRSAAWPEEPLRLERCGKQRRGKALVRERRGSGGKGRCGGAPHALGHSRCRVCGAAVHSLLQLTGKETQKLICTLMLYLLNITNIRLSTIDVL